MDSVLCVAANGDTTVIDYHETGAFTDGPYSLAVARHLRPGAEVREVSCSTRPRFAFPTSDMLDRMRAA